MNVRSILAGSALMLAFSAGTAWAQYGTIRGKVVDEKGEPVAEAEILVELQGGETNRKPTVLKTNKKGDFTQVGLPRGSYKITVSKMGFQSIFVPGQVSTGDTTDLGEIKLPPLTGAAARGQTNAELNKAVELAQAENWDAAETAFKEFLTKNPAHAMAHYNLGFVYTKKKDYTNAEAELKKAMELDPDMPQPVTLLAAVYRATSRGKEAAELIDKAAAAQPENPDFQYTVGVSLVNSGKSQEAHDAFLKVVAANPDHAEAHYFLGTTALNLGKVADALKYLEKYVAMAPPESQNVATAKALIPELKKMGK